LEKTRLSLTNVLRLISITAAHCVAWREI